MDETTSPRLAGDSHHLGLILATLCLASFMATLDLFVVNVALHDIGKDLASFQLANLSWILNGYAIIFGALLVPAGRFADKVGTKTSFITGVTIFTFASLACAVSPSLWTLVGFRCLQAAGAAVLTPASLGLVLTALPRERVENGVRVWAVTAAFAGAAGPVIGGLLTSLSWRWIFVINVPIGVAAILGSFVLLENVNYDRSTRIPDLFGSGMLIVAIGAVSLGLVKGPDWGWGDVRIMVCWAVAVLGAAAFATSNERAKAPVVDFHLFRSKVFSSANLAAFLAFGATGIQLLSISLFLQQSWHWGTITTGLAIAPGPSMVLISSFAGQALNTKFPIGRVASFGFLLIAAGMALMTVSLHDGGHSYAGSILPGWLILGTGLGLSYPTVVEAATGELPPSETAAGSAINAVARQLGGVLGTAVLVVILGRSAVTGHPSEFYNAWWVVVGACVIGSNVVLGITPKRHTTAVADETTNGGVPAAAITRRNA
jgi:EmrB/QacA subfamily drug resistance transporter